MAVITAILVVALVASAASFMAWQQQLWVRQVEQSQRAGAEPGGGAGGAAVGALDAGAGRARQQRRPSGGRLGQALTPLPVEGGELAGELTDQQGLFNLNSLVREGKVSATDLAVFRKLLELLQLSPEHRRCGGRLDRPRRRW